MSSLRSCNSSAPLAGNAQLAPGAHARCPCQPRAACCPVLAQEQCWALCPGFQTTAHTRVTMSQSSFSRRSSLRHILSCLYSGTNTSNSAAEVARSSISFSKAMMLFCCWMEERKRCQPGTVRKGHVSIPAGALSLLQGQTFPVSLGAGARPGVAAPPQHPVSEVARQCQWGQQWPGCPPLPYSVQ